VTFGVKPARSRAKAAAINRLAEWLVEEHWIPYRLGIGLVLVVGGFFVSQANAYAGEVCWTLGVLAIASGVITPLLEQRWKGVRAHTVRATALQLEDIARSFGAAATLDDGVLSELGSHRLVHPNAKALKAMEHVLREWPHTHLDPSSQVRLRRKIARSLARVQDVLLPRITQFVRDRDSHELVDSLMRLEDLNRHWDIHLQNDRGTQTEFGSPELQAATDLLEKIAGAYEQLLKYEDVVKSVFVQGPDRDQEPKPAVETMIEAGVTSDNGRTDERVTVEWLGKQRTDRWKFIYSKPLRTVWLFDAGLPHIDAQDELVSRGLPESSDFIRTSAELVSGGGHELVNDETTFGLPLPEATELRDAVHTELVRLGARALSSDPGKQERVHGSDFVWPTG
jgi:hypothetical protein